MTDDYKNRAYGKSNPMKSDAKQEDIAGEAKAGVFGTRPGVRATHDEESDYSEYADDTP